MIEDKSKPVVAVIGLGGTISTLAEDGLDFIEYPETGRKLSIDEVLAMIPELNKIADIRPVAVRSVGSSAVGPKDWLHLVDLIERLEAEIAALAGIVIFHGTATLEETAYFLNLTIKTSLPVVLVGAQRPMNTIGSDAPINAISALRVCVDPQSRGKGVLVVLNDEIHAAREVTKTSTYRVHAFQTPELGPLGVVDADRVTYYRHPVRPHTVDTPFRISADSRLPRVDIAYSYGGADSTAIDAYVAAGAKGLVSAGFAPGMPAPIERRALEQAAESGVVVVQSTRVGTGRVARRQYLENSGWVGADNLTPQKARILLMLALMDVSNADRIQEFFDTY